MRSRLLVSHVLKYIFIVVALCSLQAAIASPLLAFPWADPGDAQLRHDLYLLSDTGHIHLPLSAWPLSWGDVSRAMASVSEQELDDPQVRAALVRVQKRVERETRKGFGKPQARISLINEELRFRTFEDTPRGEGEAELSVRWMDNRFALRLQGQAVIDPQDERNFRPDGSLAGVKLGNWMFSLGYQPRWWGPSSADSLILSTNARPVPALAVQRNISQPFDLPVLEYLGRWNLRAFAGKLESDREIPRPWFIGTRVDFSPTKKLEIGLSRHMLWGGKGVEENLDEFLEYYFTGDNEVVRGENGETRVDQMAGYDFRWRSPLYGQFPYAVYGQLIGEDEAGNLPSNHIGLAGLEHWGSFESLPGSYRIFAEVSDTLVRFYRSSPDVGWGDGTNTAYNHSRYQTGNRYRGRCLGHGLDGDSQVYTLGGSLVQTDGTTWNGFLRYGLINRTEGGRHSLAPEGEYLWSGQLSSRFAGLNGLLTLGLRLNHTQSMQDSDDTDSEAIGFLTWQNRP